MEETFVKDFTRVPKDVKASQRINRVSLTYAQGVIRTLKQNKAAMISLGFIIFIIIVAIFGPIVFPNYQKTDLMRLKHRAEATGLEPTI